VPLSEEEQQILAQMEQSLAAEDPSFAQRVQSKTVYRSAGRACKWSALTFFLGLALLVALYSSNIAIGLFGIAVMFVSIVIFERNLRRLGRAGWHDLTRPGGEAPAQPTSFEQAYRGATKWFRSRLHRNN
jgi:hypothetical protein